MAAPRQMTDKTLNALKGWPNQAPVDFATKFAAAVLAARDPVLAGSVVSLDPSGNYNLGVGTSPVMPMFLFHSSDEPDVRNDGGDPATDKNVFVGITPSGNAMALVAVMAVELTSTQFVDAVYAPNDHLTAEDGLGADAGKLSLGTLWTDTICGVVSRGVVDNGYGADALAFWPVYLPPNP